jgi:hypothetical protein
VVKLAEAIYHLQVRIKELDIQLVPRTPYEVCYQRDESTNNGVGRIRALTIE